jgi:hypothetical protein
MICIPTLFEVRVTVPTAAVVHKQVFYINNDSLIIIHTAVGISVKALHRNVYSLYQYNSATPTAAAVLKPGFHRFLAIFS